MEENGKQNNINGPNNILFGLDDFESLPNTKTKNIVKSVKKEIMNQAINWCKENIKGFNVDVTVDDYGNIIINGNCYIDDPTLEMLPFKIHKINGDFKVCGDATVPRVMHLRTLENFPDIITGNFNIKLNPDLTSLAGGPREVHGHYNCAHCSLKNMIGIAPKIGQYIVAYKNPLIDIDALENSTFTNIDLEYCDDIQESNMYKKLSETGRLYEEKHYTT